MTNIRHIRKNSFLINRINHYRIPFLILNNSIFLVMSKSSEKIDISVRKSKLKYEEESCYKNQINFFKKNGKLNVS